MKCLAILVNYHCADLLLQAVRSLANDADCERLCVVDNSDCATQAEHLRAHLPPRALLLVAERNLGFGSACNLAWEQHGADADCVLLLNPDARLLPGALGHLKATLVQQPELGAVGPLTFWDDDLRFMLPPPTAPTPPAHLIELLGQHCAALRRWHSQRWRAHALALWQARQALPVAALSGGHVLLRSSALRAAGGLFDPAFFMYWEDSDLMRRLQLAGWRLLIDPKAKAVHAYEHSAQKNELMARGWPAYARKHFANRPWLWLEAALRRCPIAAPEYEGWQRLTLEDEELWLDIPPQLHAGWLLEVALSPGFVPACGHLGTGQRLRLPAALLRRLGLGPLYLRLGPPKPCKLADCLHYQLLMAQPAGPGWPASAASAAAPPPPDRV